MIIKFDKVEQREELVWKLVEYINSHDKTFKYDNNYWNCGILGILHLTWHKKWIWSWVDLQELPKELQLGEEK